MDPPLVMASIPAVASRTSGSMPYFRLSSSPDWMQSATTHPLPSPVGGISHSMPPFLSASRSIATPSVV